MYKGKKIVALCTSRVHDNYHADFINKLSQRLGEMDCILLVYSIFSDLLWYYREFDWNNSVTRSDISVFNLMRPDITDAVIIMDDRIKSRTVVEKIIDNFSGSNAEIIVIDGKYENTVYMGYNYVSGFRKVIEHIVDVHNARSFLVIAGNEDNPFSIERIDTFFDVLKSRGISTEGVRVGYGDFWSEPARKVTEDMIESGDIPDAVVCLNDIMAISASITLEKNGIRVPEDVIVTGFDGYNEIYLAKPRITSCACTTDSLTERLSEVIQRIADGQPCEKEYIIESKPIILESCGCKGTFENSFNMYDFFNTLFYKFDDEKRALLEISSRIQTSENLEAASECWRKNNIDHMTILVNKTFFSENFENVRKDKTFDDTMTVFADHLNTDHTYDFNISGVLPGIEKIFEENRPLIYMALEYGDVPIGFVCYSFNPARTLEYARIPNMTSVLSNSIGGFRSIQNQLMLRNKLEQIYITDPLTGLLNRNGFKKYFPEIIDSAASNHEMVTTVMCDLDRLKKINDKYGHSEGDNAIKKVADAIRECTPEDAICIRFGGDEISAFIPHKVDINEFIAKMHNYFTEYNKSSNKKYDVWASIGCYIAGNEEEFNYEHLIQMADSELYIDKEKNHKNYRSRKMA